MARVAVHSDSNGRKAVRVTLDNPYGGDEITPLEAERLADELRIAAKAARGGPAPRKLGSY